VLIVHADASGEARSAETVSLGAAAG
jgi:hypothetical protein